MEKSFLEEIELLNSKFLEGRYRYKKDLYIFLEELEKICDDHGRACEKIKSRIKAFGTYDLDKELTKRQQDILLQEIKDIIKDHKEKKDAISKTLGKLGNSANNGLGCSKNLNQHQFYPTDDYWKNKPTKVCDDDMGWVIKEFLESFAREKISSSVVNYVFDYLSLSSILLEENTQYLTLHLSFLDVLREEGWEFDGNGGFSHEPNNKRIYEKLIKLVTFSP